MIHIHHSDTSTGTGAGGSAGTSEFTQTSEFSGNYGNNFGNNYGNSVYGNNGNGNNGNFLGNLGTNLQNLTVTCPNRGGVVVDRCPIFNLTAVCNSLVG
jgi:hypothetical protein